MNNADAFRAQFGIYATELWSMSEEQLFAWLKASYSRSHENDAISRKAMINAIKKYFDGLPIQARHDLIEITEKLSSVIPEPSQVARDIATIIENEKDMRAIAEQRIRCAHCKRYDRHNHRCKWWNHGVSNIDWCSFAERKDGEAE